MTKGLAAGACLWVPGKLDEAPLGAGARCTDEGHPTASCHSGEKRRAGPGPLLAEPGPVNLATVFKIGRDARRRP